MPDMVRGVLDAASQFAKDNAPQQLAMDEIKGIPPEVGFALRPWGYPPNRQGFAVGRIAVQAETNRVVVELRPTDSHYLDQVQEPQSYVISDRRGNSVAVVVIPLKKERP